MIIIKLKGGIGNQMFQYAFGKNIAVINRTKLILDNKNGFFRDPYKRKYGLFVFNIEAELPGFFLSLKMRIKDLLVRIINKLKINHRIYKNLIKETSNMFDSKVLRQYDGNTYFEGYWQSEKYFSDLKDQIISDFTFNCNFNERVLNIAKEIKNSNSLSLHFRNYRNLANGRADIQAEFIYNLCSQEYYNRAINYFANIAKDIKLYIFSDMPTIPEMLTNINIPVQYISGNKDYEDLFLMSLCKNNIISNSSFSWWGAWLNNNKSKIVIAPLKWYKNSLIDTSDLIPKNWIRL